MRQEDFRLLSLNNARNRIMNKTPATHSTAVIRVAVIPSLMLSVPPIAGMTQPSLRLDTGAHKPKVKGS